MIRSNSKQHGFSAIAAVVLIVLFALLGAYMATLTGVQTVTTTLSAGGMQAWFAARSGVESGVVRVGNNNCNDFNLSLTEGGSDRFEVDVTCSEEDVFEAPDDYSVYHLTSTATRGSPGTPGYVSRSIRVSVSGAE
jgi:MSHA biogenesis protein MshP